MNAPGSDAWLSQVVEDTIDPAQPIIDPHHHLWPEGGALPYGLAELEADTRSGHRIEGTVFVQCGAALRPDGPAHLRVVGETEFVASQADLSAADGGPQIMAIVANADLTDLDHLDEVLDAHIAAAGGRFRGIRHIGARDTITEGLMIPGDGAEGLYQSDAFRQGLTQLGERGFTADFWHYHHQMQDFNELAAAVPGTTMVLDHFGTPLGVGRFAGTHDANFSQWQDDVAAAAANQNVVAKLGGLAMPDNGFGFHERPVPATSDELVEAHSKYYLHTIEVFGPERCMFESNFPVDRFSISYNVLYNAFKKMVADFSQAERDQMFSLTARRVYQLGS